MLLGTAFSTMTALLAVHGLTTAGVLVGKNGTTAFAGGLGIPVGTGLLALTALPILRRTRRVKPLLALQVALATAVATLGATEWTTFRKITLPMIAPGVGAAALLAAAISIDDYVITSFNAGQTQTFPLFIFGATRQGVPPEVNVLATCLLVIILVLMAVNVMVQRRLARRDAARHAAAEAHEQQLAA